MFWGKKIGLYSSLWLVVLLCGSIFSVQAQALPVITPETAANITELARLGQGTIYTAAVSKDGQQLALATALGVWVYDATDFTISPRLLPTEVFVTRINFSPDGRWLAAATDEGYNVKTLWVWDTQDLENAAFHLQLASEVQRFAMSSQGTWLAVIGRDSIQVFHPGETTPTFILNNTAGYTETVYFSADERILVTQTYDAARLWDLTTGQALSFSSGTRLYAFSADGQQMATYDRDRRLRVWDIADLTNITPIAAPRIRMGVGYSIQYSPDNQRLVTTGEDGIRLWDTTDYTLITHQEAVQQDYDTAYQPVFSPDGRWIAFLTQESVELWDTTQNKIIHRFRGQYRPLTVRFTPDGQTIAIFFRTYDSSRSQYVAQVGIWDTASGEKTKTYTHGIPDFSDYFDVVGTDQLWLIGESDAKYQVRDLFSDEELLYVKGHTSGIHQLAFSADGQTLAATAYNEIRLWNVEAQAEIAAYYQPGLDFGGIVFMGDGAIATSYTDSFKRVDSTTGEILAEIAIQNPILPRLSQDGKYGVVNSNYDYLDVWELSTEEHIMHVASEFYPLRFSPDNQFLAAYRSSKMQIWDIPNANLLLELERSYGDGVALAFTPDSQQFVFYSSSGQYALWDIQQEKIIAELAFPAPEKITGLTFNPEGTLLAVVYSGGEVLFWDAANHQAVIQFKAHRNDISDFVFSPDGTLFVTGSQDGTICLWGISE